MAYATVAVYLQSLPNRCWPATRREPLRCVLLVT